VSAFKSEKLIPISVTDLGPVAQELAEHFKQRSYQVECTQSPDGACEVGITRRNMFKAVVGLNSAMKVRLEACPQGTMVHARVGIFGKQAVPTAISMFVAWPVLFTQIWGMIREAELDNEAVRVVEVSLRRAQRLGGSSGGGAQSAPGASPAASGASVVAGSGVPSPAETFCTGCGTRLDTSAAFCAACGHPRTDTPQAPSHPATPEARVSP
jgi:hypothetical protein